MDDLTRLFDDCQCPDCDGRPDPDPATDYALPGGVTFGSPEWFKLMASIPVADPDEFLSECDILEDDRPTWEELEAWEEATREDPCAMAVMLADAQVKADYEQSNGFLSVLDEGNSMRWYRDAVDPADDEAEYTAWCEHCYPDGPEYDEDVEIRGHRAGTELD